MLTTRRIGGSVAVAAFISFVVTVLFMFALRPVAFAVGLVDVPGGRKRHGAAVPVIGGIAMSIGLGVGSALVARPMSWPPILIGVYLLVFVGTVDDRFDLPANVRLIAQSCAALLVALASGIVVTSLGDFFAYQAGLGPLAVPFTIMFVVTLVNAFNLIDGLDGLAGGLAFLSLVVMTLVSQGSLGAVMVSVVAGYLLFNLPLGVNSAVRAFMGDAGSTMLGLLIAVFGIYVTQGPTPSVSPTIGLWFVAVPVFDLFATIVRRLLSNRSPFAPDHEHLHHVLADNGLSRRYTLVVMLGLAAVFAGVGLLGDMFSVDDGIMLPLWLATGVLYYQMLRFPRHVVAAALWLLRRDLGVLEAEERSTSET